MHRFAILLCLFTVDPCFATERVDCPPVLRLSGGSVALAEPQVGYEPQLTATVVRLSGASAFDGPPAEGAALKPAQASRVLTRWTFEGKSQTGKWLSCDYADGLIHLVKRVADGVTSCEIRWPKASKGPQQGTHFDCR